MFPTVPQEGAPCKPALRTCPRTVKLTPEAKSASSSKNRPKKNPLRAFFEQISHPAALSVVERQLFCRCITNTTQPHISLYEKILAVAAFAFAFSVNGYAQEAAAPAESPAPAAQKCCKKIKSAPGNAPRKANAQKNAASLAAKGKSPATAPKGRSPQGLTQRTVKINKNPCRNLPARVFSAGRGQPSPFR